MAGGGQVGDGRFLCGHGGNSAGARCDIVPIIQLHENITGVDHLIVRNGHAGYETAHLRCNYSDVTANVSVVSAFRKSTDCPPLVTECCQRRDDDQCRTADA